MPEDNKTYHRGRSRRIILTGAPGAGKTTVLNELAKLGYQAVPESARAIIAARKGRGLAPRPANFAEQVLAADISAYKAIPPNMQKPIFYDRGIPDALGMLSPDISAAKNRLKAFPYSNTAYFFDAWPEIYTTDSERDQSVADALSVGASLRRWYHSLGFDLMTVPQTGLQHRVRFILDTLHIEKA